MASPEASSIKAHKKLRSFSAVLTLAVCEWFLILLLLFHAVLSYLLTKFASYCKLQPPCLICSRLDHILGHEKHGTYRTLLCSNHKLEISSLISCHIHDKLADGRGMCEDCLMSCATENKPVSASHRFLGAKLGLDIGSCSFQSPLLNNDLISQPIGHVSCSCCNKLWSLKQHEQGLFQLKSTGSGVTKPNIPLPCLPNRSQLNRQDSLKRMRAKFYGSVAPQHLEVGRSGFDPLSHVGYTELKITSDSESEFPFSDDDDGSSLVQENNDFRPRISYQRASEVPTEISYDLLDHLSINPSPLLLDQCLQANVTVPHDIKCLPSDVSVGHGLDELSWQQPDHSLNSPALPELISLDDVPPSSNTGQVHPAALLELISVDAFPSSLNVMEVPVGASSEKCTNGAEIKTNQVLNDPVLSKLDYVEPIGSCKSSVNYVGSGSPSVVAQEVAMKDSDRVKDLKLLLSETPIGQGTESTDLSSNNTSPKVQAQYIELQINDASSSYGAKMLQKSDLMERNESSLESLDGSSVSEIEGESDVDQLKRQLEYERKYINGLYKELEEERSASAIAANQAMAMITRLQEEKAGLHMEALQYLRMMEEQAEYDVEALQKANDLLAEKEKEIQDLEAELEFYRNRYTEDTMVDNINRDTCDVKGVNMVENMDSFMNDGVGFSSNLMTIDALKQNSKLYNAKTSRLKYEDEELYISQCLKNLERKLHQMSSNGALMNMPNGKNSGSAANGLSNHEEFHHNEESQFHHAIEENGLPSFSASNGHPHS